MTYGSPSELIAQNQGRLRGIETLSVIAGEPAPGCGSGVPHRRWLRLMHRSWGVRCGGAVVQIAGRHGILH
jgi:hypothetical protein